MRAAMPAAVLRSVPMMLSTSTTGCAPSPSASVPLVDADRQVALGGARSWSLRT